MTKLQLGILVTIGVLILCLLIGGVILVSGSMSNTQIASVPVSTANEPSMPTLTPTVKQLPPHKVTYMGVPFGDSKDYWMTIVVSRDLPESQARILIDHYDQLYNDAHTLSIDLHCDDVFANEAAIKDPNLKDAEYYSHVLYSFIRWRISSHKPGTEFSKADELSSHSVCK